MDFDLAQIAREAGLSEEVAVRFIEPSSGDIRELQRIALRVRDAWRRELTETILPAYAAAIARSGATVGLTATLDIDALERALIGAAERTAAQSAATRPAVAAVAGAVAARHTAEWIAALRAATGANLSPVIAASDLQGLVEGAIRRSVALIRNLDEDMYAAVEREVWDAWQQRRSTRVLTRRLRDGLGFVNSRAELIGVDQINKLAGEIDQLRFRQAGLSSYRWVTRGDDRVRPSHRANNGKVFRWDRPPAETGHPGSAIRCRCRAQAIVDPA